MSTYKNVIFTLIISSIFFSCSESETTSGIPLAGESVSVKVIPVQKSESISVVQASGQFTTDDETPLAFKTGGVIRKILVQEGSVIKKGQLLAILDLTEINAMVGQAKIAFEKANRDYKRADNLFRDSVITLEQFQNAGSALELAKQQLTSALFNQTYSEIHALSDGVVIKKLANEGQLAAAGMPVLYVSSKGSKDWILRVALSDRSWASVSVGDQATVNIEALGITAFPATVSSKSENVDQMTGSFSVDLKLANARALSLASGMFGEANISPVHKTVGWEVPYEALLDGNSENGFVFVTSDRKTAHKIPVRISAIHQNTVQVSDGLQNWPFLVVSGSAYLTDQASITIRP